MHATTLAPFKGRFTDGAEGLQRALTFLWISQRPGPSGQVGGSGCRDDLSAARSRFEFDVSGSRLIELRTRRER